MYYMEKPLNILILGDSITAGYKLPTSSRWTNILQDKMMNKTNVLHNFINNAVSGETSNEGLKRLKEYIDIDKPDIIFIMFGINDCIHHPGKSPNVNIIQFKKNLRDMIQLGRTAGAKDIFLITNHTILLKEKMEGGFYWEDKKKNYNNVIRDVAQFENVKLIDIEKYFSYIQKSQLDKMYLPDMLHLNELGNITFANFIVHDLSSALRKLETFY